MTIARLALLMVVAAGLALLSGLLGARADPVVRRATVALPGWPAGARPVTVALASDIHLGSMAMDDARLARIFGQIDALKPDLIVLAGDFIEGHDPGAGRRIAPRLTAPLARLHAPLGVVAVLGNHDYYTAPGPVADVLHHAGVTVLVNRAVRRGPLAVIGVDDAFTGHADVTASFAGAKGIGGAPLVVSHGPDVVPLLPAGGAPLVMTGHTHCGQGVLPGGIFVHRGILTGERLYDPHYRCGMVRDAHRLTIITAGLGTSGVPMRIGAPPDLWLVTLQGSRPR